MVIIPTEKRFDWKHAPVVLFAIVLLNILIYFGYQFGDTEKSFVAVVSYKQQDFFEEEWPIYQEYLKANNKQERLQNDLQLYERMDDIESEFRLLYNIVSDLEFYEYLEINSFNLFYISYLEKWAVPRQEINDIIRSVSSLAYGLIPEKMNPVKLISYQFLHGSVDHLLGNLFFLIICGFAVEAAIGHLKFLLFYLVSGVSGGLFFSLMDMSSSIPLVGASASISGVMAMYLGVFRLKKIEFFYWFFIFVGYFRAPALLLLPFYIGKEVYSYLGDTGSSVAFMAHAGGFVAGSVSMAIAYFINPKMMNDEYIEENQDLPKIQQDMAVVNDNITRFRFDSALSALNQVIKDHGKNFELSLLRFNLMKMQNNQDYKVALVQLLKSPRLKNHELTQIEKLWKENVPEHEDFTSNDLYAFAWNMTHTKTIKTAEEVFGILNESEFKHPSLSVLARKLSVVFSKVENTTKKQQYEKLADGLN